MVAGQLPSMTSQVIDAVSSSLSVIETISRTYGFVGSWNRKNTEEHWGRMVIEVNGDWMKVAKYKLAAYFASHVQQPLPPNPVPKSEDLPHVLVGGNLGRFLNLYLSRASEMDRFSLLASLKQAKKGMPRATSETLKLAEQKFASQMTTRPAHDPPSSAYLIGQNPTGAASGRVSIDNCTPTDQIDVEILKFCTRLNIEREIDRTVDELFQGVTYSVEERLRASFPSTSANYINSRAKGGSVGAILEHPSLLEGLRRPGGYKRTEETEEEKRKRGNGNEDEITNEEEWILPPGQEPGWKKVWTTFWIRLLKVAANEQQLAIPVALAEALKQRIITKGPPFTSTIVETLRRKMHDTLKRHPAFELIGSGKATEKYLLDRLGRELGPEQGYLSGDYSAATDNIFKWASERAAERIGRRLKLYEVERRLLKSNLTGNLLPVLDPETGETILKPQEVGQLMGAKTSFPILCIIVATVVRAACEKDQGRTLTLQEAPLMVNGDDNSAKCTEKGLRWWRALSKTVGLTESLGKTYYSRKFVEINSTIFAYDRSSSRFFIDEPHDRVRKRQQPFTQVRYVNAGLLFGVKRSGGAVSLRDRQDRTNTIGTRYRDLLELCPPDLIPTVHEVFVSKHREMLESVQPVPWAIPGWLGGMGITGYLQPSEKDLRIARLILLNWKSRRPINIETIRDVPWRVWKLAERRTPQPEYTYEKDTAGEKLYEDTMASEVINLLFDSEVSLSDLHPEQDNTQEEGRKTSALKQQINHNRRLWDPARYTSGLGPPIDPERLRFQALYATYLREDIVGKPFRDLIGQILLD